jgi:hypothetical protein
VLSTLNDIKFKSLAILKETDKYKKLQGQLSENPKKFNHEQLSEILEKADRVIQSHQTKKDSEYRIQTKPEIKKGVLKYLFSKKMKSLILLFRAILISRLRNWKLFETRLMKES